MARQDAAPSSPHKAEKAAFYLWLFCSFSSSHSRFLKSMLVFSYQRTKVALAGVGKRTYDTHIVGLNMSRINIIIPVYNVADYLDEFFKKMEEQTYQDFTMILVNDCSTDNSEEKILKYKEKFGERLVYIKNEKNLKLSGARNVGLDWAEEHSAELLGYLDPDDWIDNDFYEHLVNAIDEAKADLAICGIERYENGTNNRICLEMCSFKQSIVDNPEKFDDIAYMNPAVYNKVYRAEAVKGIRFREVKRSEDTCYLFDILPNIKKIALTNEPKYHYRIREDSLSGAITQDRLDSMYEEFEKMYPAFKTEKYLPYKDMFETQVFIRTACGGVSRVAFSNMKGAPRNIRYAYRYLNRVMPDWRSNKYLSFRGGTTKPQTAYVKGLCVNVQDACIYSLCLDILFCVAGNEKRYSHITRVARISESGFEFNKGRVTTYGKEVAA